LILKINSMFIQVYCTNKAWSFKVKGKHAWIALKKSERIIKKCWILNPSSLQTLWLTLLTAEGNHNKVLLLSGQGELGAKQGMARLSWEQFSSASSWLRSYCHSMLTRTLRRNAFNMTLSSQYHYNTSNILKMFTFI